MTKEQENLVEVAYKTDMTVNKNTVHKTTVFTENKFSVYIRGSNIDLNQHEISDKFNCTKEGIQIVCAAVKAIILCEGLEIDKNIKLKTHHTIVNIETGDTKKRTIRSQFLQNCYSVHFYQATNVYQLKTTQTVI